MATQILGKVGIVLKGEYSSSTTYEKLDVVTYNGQSYSAKGETTGHLPTDTQYWQLLAEKGYTPVRGTDYWTNADKTEVISNVETDIQPTLTAIETTANTANSTANTAKSIAEGANQALSYANYSAMITAFNNLANNVYNVGQNVMIVTLEVPDLWISSIESTSVPYTYTTDEAFVTELETNGYVQVGYYRLSALETQKVDLTNYVGKTDIPTSSDPGAVKVNADNGIGISSSGTLRTNKATNAEITAQTNDYRPIVPSNLDFAVSSIVGHHVTLTQVEYDALVQAGTVDANTYYYIVEE